MNNLLIKPATELVNLLKTKQLSCHELIIEYLTHIEKINPTINAIIQCNANSLIDQSKKFDQLKNKDGNLYGLPITIKDTCYVTNYYPSKGSRSLLAKEVAQKDATVVSRLKKAGALILGITNVPELLVSTETSNDIYGITKNPYNLEKTVGGSSGGEAAAIAACCSPAGIGSDAGGSIRIPSHFCGITGLKPTQYILPITGMYPNDNIGLHRQLVTFGPMARYVKDLRLLLNNILGADSIDPHVLDVKLNKKKKHKKLKVAYFYSANSLSTSNETISAINKVLKLFDNSGSIIIEEPPPMIDDSCELLWKTLAYKGDRGRSIENMLTAPPSKLLEQFLENANRCEFSVTELHSRLCKIEKLRFENQKYINKYDVVISPVCSNEAPSHFSTHKSIENYITYTILQNITGFPAIVVRVGESNQLPIGVQIIAKPLYDYFLLDIAEEIETKLGGWTPPTMITQ